MRPSILLALALALVPVAPALADASRGVRAIAVGPKLNLEAAESLERFRAEVERLMTRAHREFAPDRPNLVVLGGDWSLLTRVLGPEHAAARRARTLEEAQERLRQAHGWELMWSRATRWGLMEARRLDLLLGDRLYRPFVTTFSAAARRHGAYVLACATVPDVDGMKPFQSLRTFSDRPVRVLGSGLSRKAFLFDPDGRLVGEVPQVAVGPRLTPGRAEFAHPFELPFGKVGVALGADARNPDYLAQLDEQGCEILLLPGTEPGDWATGGDTWRPGLWLNATLGVLQASGSAHVRYTVSALPTGLYFDQVYDGQSAIMGRGERAPARLFVGLDPASPYLAEVLALSPWVVEDPRFVHGSAGPATSLRDRREYLRKVARTLRAGGDRAGMFGEALATADLALP